MLIYDTRETWSELHESLYSALYFVMRSILVTMHTDTVCACVDDDCVQVGDYTLSLTIFYGMFKITAKYLFINKKCGFINRLLLVLFLYLSTTSQTSQLLPPETVWSKKLKTNTR